MTPSPFEARAPRGRLRMTALVFPLFAQAPQDDGCFRHSRASFGMISVENSASERKACANVIVPKNR